MTSTLIEIVWRKSNKKYCLSTYDHLHEQFENFSQMLELHVHENWAHTIEFLSTNAVCFLFTEQTELFSYLPSFQTGVLLCNSNKLVISFRFHRSIKLSESFEKSNQHLKNIVVFRTFLGWTSTRWWSLLIPGMTTVILRGPLKPKIFVS